MMKSNPFLNELVDEIYNIDSRNKLRSFLEGILTPKELKEIPNRLQIVKLLKSGKSHQVISRKLGVGVATVTRGSKELNKGYFDNV